MPLPHLKPVPRPTDTLGDPGFVAEDERVEIDRRSLSGFLRSRGMDYDPTSRLRQFAGGYANRNYLIEVDGAPVVLRRPPAGTIPRGAHDMAREHRILTALAPVLPIVPRSLLLCADTEIIGAPFQLIEYRSGLVIRRETPGDLGPNAGRRIAEMLVRTLAAVHAVDAEACGLGDLGRPTGFVGRTIVGWRDRGRMVIDGGPAAQRLETLSEWLLGRAVNGGRPTLLHLDFKLDNLVLDPATLEPRALLDWDMGTRGEPLFDLATLLSYWPEAGDPPGLIEAVQMPAVEGGFGSRREAAALYAELTGRSLRDLPTLEVLARMKLAVVFMQLDRQWTTGAVKGDRYADFRRRGEQLLDHALDLAQHEAA